MQFQEMLKEEREEGRKEGREETLIDLVSQGVIDMEIASQNLGISPEDFKKLMESYSDKKIPESDLPDQIS